RLSRNRTGPTLSCRLLVPWIERAVAHRTSRCRENGFGVSLLYLCALWRPATSLPRRGRLPHLLSYSAHDPSEIPPRVPSLAPGGRFAGRAPDTSRANILTLIRRRPRSGGGRPLGGFLAFVFEQRDFGFGPKPPFRQSAGHFQSSRLPGH